MLLTVSLNGQEVVQQRHLSDKPCDLQNDLPKTLDKVKVFLTQPKQTADEFDSLWWDMEYLQQCIGFMVNRASYQTNAMTYSNKLARCEDINTVANLLHPYNQWLVQVEFADKNSTNQRLLWAVASLLDYTKPDEAFRQALEQKARENSENISFAFGLLYEHDLVTESMKEYYSNYVHNLKNPEERKRQAMGAAYYGLGNDAIPYCEELLSQPFKPDGLISDFGYPQGNQLTTDYERACDTLGCIGTNAASLLPLLKKRQDEVMNTKGIDPAKPGILARFYTAIQCLEGKRPVTRAGKSPYCMWCSELNSTRQP